MPEHQATPIHEHRYVYPTVIALPPSWCDRDTDVVHPAVAPDPWGDLETAPCPGRMGTPLRPPQPRGAAVR